MPKSVVVSYTPPPVPPEIQAPAATQSPAPPPDSVRASAHCSPCEARRLQAATEAKTARESDAAWTLAATADPDHPRDRAWEGPLGHTGELTGDSRLLSAGSLRVDSLPLPLRYVSEDNGGHDGAVVVGLIQTVEFRDDGAVWATGVVDTSSEYGSAVYAGMVKGLVGGVSMDLDDVTLEVRVRRDVYDAISKEKAAPQEEAAETTPTPPPPQETDGYVRVGGADPEEEIYVVTDARIRAATLCAIPAFSRAVLTLVSDPSEDSAPNSEPPALVAAGISRPPSAAMFAPLHLDGPSPLAVDENGWVRGHIALHDSCHTGYPGLCVSPPRSQSGYSYFHTGALVLDDGTEQPVGHITLDTGHANTALSATAAMAHYDNTATIAADVVAYEDSHGIYVTGALRAGISPSKAREVLASAVSGDWRELGGSLELVAVLSVPVPGFPVPRTRALVAGGRTQVLQVPAPVHLVEEKGTGNGL